MSRGYPQRIYSILVHHIHYPNMKIYALDNNAILQHYHITSLFSARVRCGCHHHSRYIGVNCPYIYDVIIPLNCVQNVFES